MLPKNFSVFIGTLFAAFALLIIILLQISGTSAANAESKNNFGLPGYVDLPSAKRLPDGELVVTQQLHEDLARIGLTFQALPYLGLSFRYSGHGSDGYEAYKRVNHDRSFDAHLTVIKEGKYRPAISIGLRDFIGTGWYSSEYIAATKTFEKLEMTAGLGFGRLAGRNKLENPFKFLHSGFENRGIRGIGVGGTFGTIGWFQGDASVYGGFSYALNDKLKFAAEYNPDSMTRENYIPVNSNLNYSIEYKINKFFSVSAQYLHGSRSSITGSVSINPKRPPYYAGKELAPVPMRRSKFSSTPQITNEKAIRKVLEYDKFNIISLHEDNDQIILNITNTKFRSYSQSLGRITSTVQRFASDQIKYLIVVFVHDGLQTASYKIDLKRAALEQKNPSQTASFTQIKMPPEMKKRKTAFQKENRLSWGLGPYVTHRLFNPDLPFSAETGAELEVDFRFLPNLSLSGSIRKSLLTNLTDNQRRSNSVLPRVHSDWPLYDFAGQDGHVHSLKVTYLENLGADFFFRIHAGLLEPHFGGVGSELLYKPNNSPLAFGLDINKVKKRDYDMLFNFREYEETVGHFSFYYDAGGILNIEMNAGKYLAGDWGLTTNVSRLFGNGWEVGGYATFTDVPFEVFGEGSFDKGIYVNIPLDWILGTPDKSRRHLGIRPITRDGGAHLASSRTLYKQIKYSQNSFIRRELGRFWK